MSAKRVLGILGLDHSGSLVARRALDAGTELVLHGPTAGDWLLGEAPSPGIAKDISSLVAALRAPRALLIGIGTTEGLGAAGSSRKEVLLREALARLEPGDLVLACSGDSWPDFTALIARCADGGLGLVDLGVSGGKGRGGASVLTAGGKVKDWELACRFIGSGPGSALLGRSGSGGSAALVRSAMEGLQVELIAEAYHILKSGIRMSHDEMRTIFAHWNSGDLADPLLAATADALGLMDEDGEPLIAKVLDAAAATGPCSKAAALAIQAGVPSPMIAQAASASAIAAMKDERIDASAVLGGPKPAPTGDRQAMADELRKALLAASILAAAEGFSLLGISSERRELRLDLALAARLWAEGGGSKIMSRAAEALGRSGGRWTILLDASFKTHLDQSLPSLRRVAARALESGIPVPALSAALAFYDGYRSTWLPASLSNALKDSIQGLGYERIDRPRGEVFHSEWK